MGCRGITDIPGDIHAHVVAQSVNSNETVTTSPSPSDPRTFFGSGKSTRPLFSRHTLVVQRVSPNTATTGMRPHGPLREGAQSAGTAAKVQPPVPG